MPLCPACLLTDEPVLHRCPSSPSPGSSRVVRTRRSFLRSIWWRAQQKGSLMYHNVRPSSTFNIISHFSSILLYRTSPFVPDILALCCQSVCSLKMAAMLVLIATVPIITLTREMRFLELMATSVSSLRRCHEWDKLSLSCVRRAYTLWSKHLRPSSSRS